MASELSPENQDKDYQNSKMEALAQLTQSNGAAYNSSMPWKRQGFDDGGAMNVLDQEENPEDDEGIDNEGIAQSSVAPIGSTGSTTGLLGPQDSKGSGVFTNIAQYKAANLPKTQELSNQVIGKVGSQATDISNKIKAGEEKYKEAISGEQQRLGINRPDDYSDFNDALGDFTDNQNTAYENYKTDTNNDYFNFDPYDDGGNYIGDQNPYRDDFYSFLNAQDKARRDFYGEWGREVPRLVAHGTRTSDSPYSNMPALSGEDRITQLLKKANTGAEMTPDEVKEFRKFQSGEFAASPSFQDSDVYKQKSKLEALEGLAGRIGTSEGRQQALREHVSRPESYSSGEQSLDSYLFGRTPEVRGANIKGIQDKAKDARNIYNLSKEQLAPLSQEIQERAQGILNPETGEYEGGLAQDALQRIRDARGVQNEAGEFEGGLRGEIYQRAADQEALRLGALEAMNAGESLTQAEADLLGLSQGDVLYGTDPFQTLGGFQHGNVTTPEEVAKLEALAKLGTGKSQTFTSPEQQEQFRNLEQRQADIQEAMADPKAAYDKAKTAIDVDQRNKSRYMQKLISQGEELIGKPWSQINDHELRIMGPKLQEIYRTQDAMAANSAKLNELNSYFGINQKIQIEPQEIL